MCFLNTFVDVTLPTDDVEDMILKLRQLLSKGKSEQDFMDSTLSLSSMSINSKNVTTGRSVMHALGLKVSISYIEKKVVEGELDISMLNFTNKDETMQIHIRCRNLCMKIYWQLTSFSENCLYIFSSKKE